MIVAGKWTVAELHLRPMKWTFGMKEKEKKSRFNKVSTVYFGLKLTLQHLPFVSYHI